MSAAAHAQPTPSIDPVVAAMLAQGWSDAEIGAALRAVHGLRGGVVPAQPAQQSQNDGANSQNATVATVAKQPSQNAFSADGRMKHWADASALAKQRDPMLAAAAFEVMPALTRVQRAVGVTLMRQFYNAKTRRCDPSAGGLARAAGCNRASIFRAIKVFEAMGLLRRFSYAGKHHCNAYAPDWDRCCDVVMAAQQSQNDVLVGQQSQQPSHNATQTQIEINISPLGLDTGGQQPPKRQKRGKVPDRRQREIPLLRPLAGGGGKVEAIKAARGKAHERLSKAFDEKHLGHGGAIMRGMSPAAWASGIEAEMSRPGAGLTALEAALEAEMHKRTGTDPP